MLKTDKWNEFMETPVDLKPLEGRKVVMVYKPEIGRWACRESNLAPLTHDERLALIYAPFPTVHVNKPASGGHSGPKCWPLHQMDGDFQ